MNKAVEFIARNYAIAFVNVYGDTITDQRYHDFQGLVDLFGPLKSILFFINTATFAPEVAEKIHAKIAEVCHAYRALQSLLDRLYADRRLVLLPRIIDYIIEEYRHRHNIMPGTIFYAHELTIDQKKDFEDFFSSLVAQTVEFAYELDQSLIAGIRFQTDTVMWEYSVDKQLRILKQSCKEKDPDGN